MEMHLICILFGKLGKSSFTNGWKCSRTLSHTLANSLLSLSPDSPSHTHTLSHTQSWSSGCSSDDLAIVYSSCQSIVYCGSAQLPSPHSHTHAKRCKWRPSFSLPLQPLPNYHGTEAVIKKKAFCGRMEVSSQTSERLTFTKSGTCTRGFLSQSRKDGYNVG